MARSVCFLLVLLLSISCKETTPEKKIVPSKPVSELFSEFYEFKKGINPIEASKAGYSKYNDTIADYISDDYLLHLKDRYTYFLEEMNQYDSTAVASADWMSLRVMQWDCNIKLEGLMNPLVTVASPIYDLPSFELMPLFQIQSLHLYVAQLAGGTSIQPFKTSRDYKNWLKRLDDYLIFLDTAMEKMELGAQKDVILPKVLIEKMIPQIQSFIGVPLEDNLFYQPIKNIPNSIPEGDRENLKSKYVDMISNKLVPKYEELNKFLTESYLPKGRDTDGLGALPNGSETYTYLIKLHTTTNMTAEEIHELGLSEVKRISAEMETIKKELGYEGDLRSFFSSLRSKKELIPFSKPDEVIANFNQIKERVDLKIDSLFQLTPKGGFNVRRTEAFREASASAEYTPGSKDASRPGIFYVPIPDVTAYNTLHDEALFLHEAIPGHHFQLSLQQENNNLPAIFTSRKYGGFC